MNRFLAIAFALLCAGLSISSACIAQTGDLISFTLQPQRSSPGKIHATFRHQGRAQYDNSWSAAFMPSDLIGMEVSSFHGSGTRPLHFAIVREAGRLDCAGNAGGDYASGNCRFTPDANFTQLLVRRGIGRPTGDQAFGLMAINARRELIDALAAARYPTPSIGNLMALSALRVDGRYIADMARAGYRPSTLQTLIQFKALGITPEWIAGFVRVGYANVPADQLVQMRALGITPDYVAAFQRIGYRNLPVSKLVQLKALDITPAFVRASVGAQRDLPPVGQLVDRKISGKRP
jgi:hypothetical protein